MTLWQYAIACQYGKLLTASEDRLLTDEETRLVRKLRPTIERYEAAETCPLPREKRVNHAVHHG